MRIFAYFYTFICLFELTNNCYLNEFLNRKQQFVDKSNSNLCWSHPGLTTDPYLTSFIHNKSLRVYSLDIILQLCFSWLPITFWSFHENFCCEIVIATFVCTTSVLTSALTVHPDCCACQNVRRQQVLVPNFMPFFLSKFQLNWQITLFQSMSYTCAVRSNWSDYFSLSFSYNTKTAFDLI